MNTYLPSMPELLKTKNEKKTNKVRHKVITEIAPRQVDVVILAPNELNQITHQNSPVEKKVIPESVIPSPSEGLNWQKLSRLSNKGEIDAHLAEQQKWGQMVDMLLATAPETQWSCVWFGSQHLSSNLIAHVYHFLNDLLLSPDWHSPKEAEIQFGRRNGLPALKISWEKTDLPPLFIDEKDDVEVFVEYGCGKEIINFLEIHYSSNKRKEV